MSEIVDSVPELIEAHVGCSMASRTTSISQYVGLGPPDMCALEKVKTTLTSYVFHSEQPKFGYVHWVYGADVRSPASLSAYFMDVLHRQQQTSWFQSTAYNIVRATFCLYCPFSRVDVRVVMDIPGSVTAFAIDSKGNKSDNVPDVLWREGYLGSLLRAIDPRPFSHACIRVTDAYTGPALPIEAEYLFLKHVREFFDRGIALGTPLKNMEANYANNYLTKAVEDYFSRTFRLEDAIRFFTDLLGEYGEVSAVVCRAHAAYRRVPGASTSLDGAMRIARKLMLVLVRCSLFTTAGVEAAAEELPDSVDVLLTYCQLLVEAARRVRLKIDDCVEEKERLDLKESHEEQLRDALSAVRNAVQHNPSSTDAWILLSRIYIILGAYDLALISLNVTPLPMENKEEGSADELLGLPSSSMIIGRTNPPGHPVPSWFYEDQLLSTQKGDEAAEYARFLRNYEGKAVKEENDDYDSSEEDGTESLLPPDTQLRMLPGNFLSDMYRNAYGVLLGITREVGWESLLEYRSRVFYMEGEASGRKTETPVKDRGEGEPEEGSDDTELVERKDVDELVKGNDDNELVEGKDVDMLDSELIKGKDVDEHMEGNDDAELVEGNDDSELAEGKDVDEHVEGNDDTELAEGKDVDAPLEGNDDSELAEGKDVDEHVEGNDDSKLAQGSDDTVLVEGQGVDMLDSELIKGKDADEHMEGNDDSKLAEGSDVDERVEGNDDAELVEGNDVDAPLEGNDDSELAEGRDVDEHVEGNDVSKLVERKDVDELVKGNDDIEHVERKNMDGPVNGMGECETVERDEVDKPVEGTDESESAIEKNVDESVKGKREGGSYPVERQDEATKPIPVLVDVQQKYTLVDKDSVESTAVDGEENVKGDFDRYEKGHLDVGNNGEVPLVPKGKEKVANEDTGSSVDDDAPQRSEKRLCARWLDDLFHALYQDLRLFAEWRAEEAQALNDFEKASSKDTSATQAEHYDFFPPRPAIDWINRGRLADRLERPTDAEAAYRMAAYKNVEIRAYLPLLELYSKNGVIKETLMVAVVILRMYSNWALEERRKSPPHPKVTTHVLRIVSMNGLQKVRDVYSDLKDKHSSMDDIFHSAVRGHSCGYDWR